MPDRMLAVSAEARLGRLFWLRNVSIAGQLVAVLIAAFVLDIELPLAALAAITGAFAAFNALTAWRLRDRRPASDPEVFGQLSVDVVLLSVALYLTGGAANPFVSLYLLPLTIAATALPMRYAWTMTILTVAAYTVLLFWYQPLGDDHARHSDAFGLHVLGMWLNFLLSAALIASFVASMAESLRARDREVATARERALRDRQLVALGTFAAGAAHELGTPLSTMAVIVKDMERERPEGSRLVEDLRALREQVEACKRIVTSLVGRAGSARAESVRLIALRELIAEAENRWSILRPASRLTVRIAGDGEAPAVMVEETTVQALVSLLNNAADASAEPIEVVCDWSAREVTIEIRDEGPGMSDEARRMAGVVPYTEKPGRGLGLGLLLAKAAVERLGGRVDLGNRAQGGATTRVTLPTTARGAA
ncbi:MAG TPA: ATP-binding protein [Burkholderiales bacterium]|nr:ATP-binding protein [Burkholderiales bacterium]